MWEEGEYHRYIVENAPADPSLAALQMVALGGMPEGGEVLSCRFVRSEEDPSSEEETFSLTLSFNEEVKEYFLKEESLPVLQGMVYSFRSFYEEHTISQISFCFEGEEILCAGRRASDFLADPLPKTAGQAVPYRSLR